jgi:hypothetical protein
MPAESVWMGAVATFRGEESHIPILDKWLWRIVPGLGWIPDTESGFWMLMFLEVVRRWMWVCAQKREWNCPKTRIMVHGHTVGIRGECGCTGRKRFSWLWRIVPGLGWIPDTESGFWMLMFLEVVRRFELVHKSVSGIVRKPG